MEQQKRILYCHCAYARVVSENVKTEVLKKLSASNVAFDAVADLCEMSADKSERLKSIAESGPLQIVACYPRAVKWLFAAAKAPLSEDVEILNMRTQPAEEIAAKLCGKASQ